MKIRKMENVLKWPLLPMVADLPIGVYRVLPPILVCCKRKEEKSSARKRAARI